MKKILITIEPWEKRIAVTRDDELENVYFSSSTDNVIERSFFKGVVSKVFSGIQTAFVDIGQERAGFLHISEVDRELMIHKIDGADQLDIMKEQEEGDGEQTKYRSAKDIGTLFKEGEEILVQVSKEPIGEKGAKLTTCFTLPGRFIVLMPNVGRICISKKIGDAQERARLKEIIEKHLPAGMGAIVRTSSEDATEQEIYTDINFLLNDWKEILDRYTKASAKTKIYEDLDLPIQVVRDHLDKDIEMIITDNKQNQDQLYQYLKNVAPEFRYKVLLYEESKNLFDHFNISKQIERALCAKVFLKSGGSIVIESTEAMTSIDVNTGRFTGKKDLEDTILKTNMEAAKEIVRQLRLRNIGGLIVIDFIDMNDLKNRQKLVESFEQALKKYDKFQSVVLAVSEFGLVQMTRKRSGKTLSHQLTKECEQCHGHGRIKSIKTESYEILRRVAQEMALFKNSKSVTVKVHPDIFDFIASIEYDSILNFEQKHGFDVVFQSQLDFAVNQYKIETTK